jgi:hypothetical protein
VNAVLSPHALQVSSGGNSGEPADKKQKLEPASSSAAAPAPAPTSASASASAAASAPQRSALLPIGWNHTSGFYSFEYTIFVWRLSFVCLSHLLSVCVMFFRY